MSSYSILGTAKGKETVYEYTRRRWQELQENFKAGKSPGVYGDKAGAYAASKLIFVELKKSPGLVTDEIPPEAVYIESMINNPRNPLTWISQKASQAASSAAHKVAVNLDKPAQALQDIGKALPWYTKPGAIVGIIIAVTVLPPLAGHLLRAAQSRSGRKGSK